MTMAVRRSIPLILIVAVLAVILYMPQPSYGDERSCLNDLNKYKNLYEEEFEYGQQCQVELDECNERVNTTNLQISANEQSLHEAKEVDNGCLVNLSRAREQCREDKVALEAVQSQCQTDLNATRAQLEKTRANFSNCQYKLASGKSYTESWESVDESTSTDENEKPTAASTAASAAKSVANTPVVDYFTKAKDSILWGCHADLAHTEEILSVCESQVATSDSIIARCKKQFNSSEAERDELQSAKEELEKKLEGLQNQIAKIQKAAEVAENRAVNAEIELDLLRKKLEEKDEEGDPVEMKFLLKKVEKEDEELAEEKKKEEDPVEMKFLLNKVEEEDEKLVEEEKKDIAPNGDTLEVCEEKLAACQLVAAAEATTTTTTAPAEDVVEATTTTTTSTTSYPTTSANAATTSPPTMLGSTSTPTDSSPTSTLATTPAPTTITTTPAPTTFPTLDSSAPSESAPTTNQPTKAPTGAPSEPVPITTSQPTGAPTAVGDCGLVIMRSVKYPDNAFVNHRGGPRMVPVPGNPKRSTPMWFYIRPCLKETNCGRHVTCVSLESYAAPNHYIHHKDDAVFVDQNHDNEEYYEGASWCLRTGFVGGGDTRSFEPVNDRGKFISSGDEGFHMGLLPVAKHRSSEDEKSIASFTLEYVPCPSTRRLRAK